MRGYNVLFPAGTQPSGLPTVAFSKRVADGHKATIMHLKVHGVPDEIINKLTDPYFAVEFFRREYVKLWMQMGYSIDWRRDICSIDKDYNKFIEWQFQKLMEQGLLIQKPHFAPYCPNCGPVAVDPSQTDISRGGSARIVEFTIIKFKSGDYVLPAATLRPETIFGVTNLWVNKTAKYGIVKMGGERWILSREAITKIQFQKEAIEIEETELSGKDLVGKEAESPITGRKVLIFHADFVNPDFGTGIVMSVPAHDPYDWLFLEKINAEHRIKIAPISIIEIEGYSEYPSSDIIKNIKGYQIEDLNALEQAKEKLYRDEMAKGVMKSNCGEYAGLRVNEAREKIKRDLISMNLGDIFYDFSEEVICRCGSRVYIKRIPDQWFIKYSDENLKKKAHECAKEMIIKPDEYAENIHNVIDWFNDRACVRKGRWLGTRFPFDPSWIIEPISDSTIYPAMYIISKYTNARLLKVEQLVPEFFDFVFLGKGDPENISKSTGIPIELIKEIRKDFEYWYPVDMNCGGKEHMTVHFPVYIFNHVAIFPKKYWPKGIFVNWWVTGKGGDKISKSKGGATPVPDLVNRFTADGLRLYYAHAASPHSDMEWDEHLAERYAKRIEMIFRLSRELLEISQTGYDDVKMIDKWILSRVNKAIKEVTRHMDNYEIREAAHIIFFELYKDIQWWMLRGGRSRNVAKYVLEKWTLMMAPFTPHIAEENWEKMGNKTFVSLANWCSYEPTHIDENLEFIEGYIKTLISDITEILKIVKKKPTRIYIYTAPNWMWKLVEIVRRCEGDIKKSINVALKDKSIVADKKSVNKVLKHIIKQKLHGINYTINEEEILRHNKEFLERYFGSSIEINSKHDPLEKRKNALPLKPAIAVE